MRYALLIWSDEATDPEPGTQAAADQMADYMAFQESAGKAITAGERLHRVADATTVQVRDGEVLTSDGPFAETKEQMAGFYLVDAKDLDEAIDIASKIPSAKRGSIEVRPIWEM
jgi:hypothetical protein